MRSILYKIYKAINATTHFLWGFSFRALVISFTAFILFLRGFDKPSLIWLSTLAFIFYIPEIWQFMSKKKETK